MTESVDARTDGQPSHRGLLWVLIGIVAAIVTVPLLVLGWLGLVPGLSSVMGANEAKDLGVQYSTVDIQSYHSKSGIKFEAPEAAPDHPTKPGKKKVFDHPKKVETRFTQEELSAALNGASLAWLPLKDIQLRLSDRTIEISGVLSNERVPELLRQAVRMGYSEADLAKVAAYAEKLPGDVPVYLRAAGGVQNAQLDLELQEVAIGRFALPADVLAKIAPNGIHTAIKGSDQFAVDSALPQDGSLAFSGILPTTIYLKQR